MTLRVEPMYQLFIEERPQSGSGISGDLAKHLYARMFCGKVVIVCDNPKAYLPVIRKQWLKVMRQVQKEQASTLDAVKIHALTSVIAEMQNLQFTTQSQRDNLDADIYLATPEQLLAWAPVCQTLYVTDHITKEQLYLVAAWMPRHAVVVQYKTTCE